MRIRYALHERTSSNGFAWTWRAEDLQESLLDDFLYRIQMPDDAYTIRPEHLRGGILKFAQVHDSQVDEHVVLYRFYDGGSDEGRSRVTMLTAWTTPDQFPAPPTANGVLELFRNQLFEDLSNQARTIGIEQPYSLICDERLPATTETPSAALADFLQGLTDADHDYSLMIQNDHHVMQKTPSAVLKDRKKREKVEEQSQADETKREVEKAKLRDHKGKPEVKETALPVARQKRWISRPIKVLICLTLIGISSLGFVMWKDLKDLWNPPEFPAAQKIVDLFQQLPLRDQQQVLNQLQRIMKKNSQPQPLQKSPTGG